MKNIQLILIGSGLTVVILAAGFYFFSGSKGKSTTTATVPSETKKDSAKGNETEKPASVEKNNNAGYDVNIADHKKMGGVVRDAKKKYENKLCYGKIGAGFTYSHSANVGNTAENNKNNLHRSILHGLATMNENEINAGAGILLDALTDYGNYSHNEKKHANELVNIALSGTDRSTDGRFTGGIDEFTGFKLNGKTIEIVGLDKIGNCRRFATDLNSKIVKPYVDDGLE